MDTRTSPTRLRIERIRDVLRHARCAAALIPSSDPHLSEYLPERWQGRQWASGFTGSVGTLIVTIDHAVVFADSRYWVQAERELADSGVDLVKIGTPAGVQHVEWLCRHVPAGETVAVDGDVLGLAAARHLEGESRPVRHPAAQRSRRLRHRLGRSPRGAARRCLRARRPRGRGVAAAAGSSACATRCATPARPITSSRPSTTSPGCSNLRGADVSYNPVFLAHVLIDAHRATLFVSEAKIDAPLRAALAADGVDVRGYDEAGAALCELPADATLLLDPKRVTLGTRRRTGARIVESINPSTLAKSRKSDAESAHVRRAMIEDGAAMCTFYAWFEAALADPRAPRAHHRADDRRPDDPGPVEAARLRRPELRHDRRLQMPTARCRTTAPRRIRTRPSKAMAFS